MRAPAVNVPAPAGAVRKVTDVGNGVTRIDQPGASPLFTNLEGGADNASNVALMNRQRFAKLPGSRYSLVKS
jgi:hypothetical protein